MTRGADRAPTVLRRDAQPPSRRREPGVAAGCTGKGPVDQSLRTLTQSRLPDARWPGRLWHLSSTLSASYLWDEELAGCAPADPPVRRGPGGKRFPPLRRRVHDVELCQKVSRDLSLPCAEPRLHRGGRHETPSARSSRLPLKGCAGAAPSAWRRGPAVRREVAVPCASQRSEGQSPKLRCRAWWRSRQKTRRNAES